MWLNITLDLYTWFDLNFALWCSSAIFSMPVADSSCIGGTFAGLYCGGASWESVGNSPTSGISWDLPETEQTSLREETLVRPAYTVHIGIYPSTQTISTSAFQEVVEGHISHSSGLPSGFIRHGWKIWTLRLGDVPIEINIHSVRGFSSQPQLWPKIPVYKYLEAHL